MGLSSSKNNADLFSTTNGVIAQKTPLPHNSQIEILEMMTNQKCKWERFHPFLIILVVVDIAMT